MGIKIMDLADYLTRIDYSGPLTPNLDCLNAIHRQHLRTIPYENLDVQLRRPLDLDLERIFEKLVHRRRGGWCYEMNGLLGWALAEIGFDVMRMTGGVGRKLSGDEVLGNHLVLSVDLDGPRIADVGLGNGLAESIPLRPGRYIQGDRDFRLELLDDGLWRFHNSANTMPSDFDFDFAPADESRLEKTCDALQSDPNSLFRQNLICMRLADDGVHFLLGRVLVHFSSDGPIKNVLDSSDEFRRTLRDLFELIDDEAADLWPIVTARHAELFGDKVADDIQLG